MAAGRQRPPTAPATPRRSKPIHFALALAPRLEEHEDFSETIRVTDSPNDSEPPLETTSVHDLSAIRAQLRRDEQVRDRHVLVRMNGSFVGQVHSLRRDSCMLGRSKEAHVWVDEPGVSRRHARIDPVGDRYALVDLESANGTYVFGQRVEQHSLADGDLIQLGSNVLFRYSITDAEHERMLATLYEASVRDPLTGIYNREHFDERLQSEVSYAKRHGTGVSLIMFDLDHFKRVNDTYGHPTGDRVLVRVTRAVAGSVRTEDVVARYGGEEFVVVLRNIDLEGTRVLAERLRRIIERLRIPHEEGELQVTASFGCAALSCCEEISTAAIIAAADARLLAAKRAGRNRVVSDDEPHRG